MAKPEFSSSIVVSTDYSLMGAASTWGRLPVNAAAVEVMIGVAKLAGRTTVSLQAHPDNTGYVYIGFDNTVSTAKYGIVLPAGMAVQVTLNNTDNMAIWAIGSAAGQFLAVIEGKV